MSGEPTLDPACERTLDEGLRLDDALLRLQFWMTRLAAGITRDPDVREELMQAGRIKLEWLGVTRYNLAREEDVLRVRRCVRNAMRDVLRSGKGRRATVEEAAQRVGISIKDLRGMVESDRS